MADKKKMSVADILAAARKSDGSGDAPSAEPQQDAEAPAAEASVAPAGGSPKPVPQPGSSGRPNVSDILAMARAGKSAGEKPAAKEKPAPKPAAKPAAAKPAAAKAKGAAGPTEPRDTASILAAARKKDRPGPVTKAEAAAKASPAAAATAKAKLAVPPLPAKPDYAKPKPAPQAAAKGADVGQDRRGFLSVGFWALGGVTALWTLLSVRYLFPNVLREPPSRFKVGFPDEFPAGSVSTKFKAQYGIWVVNTDYDGKLELVALKSVCTHLGCTPNWLEAEQKFKCPCHGSGFYKDGINFEGPAPRPLERYAIRIADDGQIEVDKSRTFQEEMGQWADPSSFISV